MADKSISQLNAASLPLAGTELLPLVQGGITKNVTAAGLLNPPSSTFASLPAASTVPGQIYNVSDVGVSGSLWRSDGTNWVSVSDTVLISQTAIPFIYLSSGSVAANGAISGITSLVTAYPHAYCYFPANVLSDSGAGSAAGWYYCTFSTVTAGVAYLNTYTSGAPTIPSSPTAVTNGQGAFTSGTGEIAGINITIPANVIGVRGCIRSFGFWAYTSNANAKTILMRINGTGVNGSAFYQGAQTSNNNFAAESYLYSLGASNTAFGQNAVGWGLSTPNNGSHFAYGISLQTATTIWYNMSKATATDNVIFVFGHLKVQPFI